MAWPSKKIKTTCMSWKSVCWQYYSICSRCWRATQIFPTCWKKLVSLPTITGQIESAISSLLIVMFKDLSERHFIDFFIWESMTCFYITLNNVYISLSLTWDGIPEISMLFYCTNCLLLYFLLMMTVHSLVSQLFLNFFVVFLQGFYNFISHFWYVIIRFVISVIDWAKRMIEILLTFSFIIL